MSPDRPYDPIVAESYRLRRGIAVACTVVFYAVLVTLLILLIATGGLGGRFASSPLPFFVLLSGVLAVAGLRLGYRCPSCGAGFGRMSGFWPVAFDACPMCGAAFVSDVPGGARPEALSDAEVIARFQSGRARFRRWSVVAWLLIAAGMGTVLLIRSLVVPAFVVMGLGVVFWTVLVDRFLRCPRCHRTPLISGNLGGVLLDPEACPHCGARLR